jgi:hypothetical protein
MPKEIATDLAALALYDIVILADDSSSMAFEEEGERIADLRLIFSKVPRWPRSSTRTASRSASSTLKRKEAESGRRHACGIQ